MPKTLSLLQRAEIASPCPAKWDEMEGDDRKRFCHQCSKHVYNFASMTDAEAERLLRENEGKVCGRIYRRDDGTILTADCPVGFANLRRVVRRRLVACVGAFLVVMFTLEAVVRGVTEMRGSGLADNGAVKLLVKWAKDEPKPSGPAYLGGLL